MNRKVVLFLFLVLSFVNLFAFKLDFSLTGYLTYDINNAGYDNFPIAYCTLTFPEPLNNFSLRFTDYLTYTHGTVELLGYNFILPRYYFIEGRFDYGNLRFTLQAGRLRLSRNLTQNFESVRLGGFKFDTYDTRTQVPLTWGGVAGFGSYRFGDYTIELGGAYSVDLGKFSLYGVITLNMKQYGTSRLGAYYENRYENVSVNYSHQIKGDFGQINFWSGIAATTSNLYEPSFLIGSTWKNGPWTVNGQFVYIGANKYDVEFGSGEPSNPNAPYTWNVMGELGYDFGQFAVSAFLKHNSRWLENEWLPLYGFRFKVGDFMISFANGDLSSSLLGVQNVLLQITYNYKVSVDLGTPFSSIATQVSKVFSEPARVSEESSRSDQKETSKLPKVRELYNLPEGTKVTVRGTVLAPVGLLSANTTYINDETAGIMLYGRSIPSDLKVGDVVEVSGTTKIYNGILEIVVDNVTKIGTSQVIKPKDVEVLDIRDLSNLVRVYGTVKSSSKDTLILENSRGTIKIYIKAATGIDVSKFQVGQVLEVVGIVSLFKNELELLPRSTNDIVVK